ncbi:integrase DNA-binding domain-containing protein [[Ruminococcus] lactaris]
MAQSRKDSSGYALRSGECQRADGRYSYSEKDIDVTDKR